MMWGGFHLLCSLGALTVFLESCVYDMGTAKTRRMDMIADSIASCMSAYPGSMLSVQISHWKL